MTSWGGVIVTPGSKAYEKQEEKTEEGGEGEEVEGDEEEDETAPEGEEKMDAETS